LNGLPENASALSKNELSSIHSATLDILEKTGVRVDEENALKLLKDAGARVDFKEKIVKIPRGLIEEMTKKARKQVTLCGRDPKHDVVLGKGQVHVMTESTGINVLDMNTGAVRTATKKDVEDSARLADALENIHIYSIMVDALDYQPEEIMSLEEIDAMLNNTEKHIDTGALGTALTRDMIAMAAAVVGGYEELKKRPIIDFMQTPVSPLIHERKNTEGLLLCAKHEVPIIVLNMAQAGGTAPMTLAGLLSQINAEVLSGMLMAYLVNRNVPLVYGTTSIVLNQKFSSGPSIFGLVEEGLISTASAQLAKYYGFPCVVGAGFGARATSDSREVSFLAALTFVFPALVGADILYGVGLIDEAKTLAYEEMVAGNEVAGMVLRGVRGFEVNDETLAEELINKIGHGGNFLYEKHTLQNLTREVFIPKIFDKPTLKDVLRSAREKAKQILATHQPEPLDKGVKEQLRNIIKEASRRQKKPGIGQA
jgi:trimethylamine--corrinoid protein Co-methyltransferase